MSEFTIAGAHEVGCRCTFCDWRAAGMSEDDVADKYKEWEQAQVEKHGWFVHFIGDDDACPMGVNFHTHGLDKYDHLDLQIVVPVSDKVAMGIFHNIVNRIKDGESFNHGDIVSEIAGKGYNIKFHAARETNRDVLRVIIPDADNNLDRDNITGGLAKQYEDLES